MNPNDRDISTIMIGHLMTPLSQMTAQFDLLSLISTANPSNTENTPL